MSLDITRRPQKLFASSTKFSRWTGIHNPYNFEFTRQDYGVYNTAIRNAYSTTLPTVWCDGDVSAEVFVGDKIYVNSGVYNGVYTVNAVNGQYITINTPFIGNGGSGRVNFVERFVNYRAFINIYDAVTDNVIETVYPKPDSTGLLIYDVSGVLRSLLNTQAQANQTNINEANENISGSFYIGYGWSLTFNNGTEDIDITTAERVDDAVYYWLSAAKQIDGDLLLGMDGIGQNFKDYVPKNMNGSEAKFLTMFETPTYFEGFPFTLSFLYDEDFSDVYLERHQQDLNVNGVDVGAETDTNLSVSGKGYVNQLKVRTPNTGSDSFDVWLETGDVIEDGYVDGGYVVQGYTNLFAAAFTG